MNLRGRSSVVGLSLEPHETAVCRLHRQGSVLVPKVNLGTRTEYLRAPIPASLFKTDPERAGQELRAQLKNPSRSHAEPGKKARRLVDVHFGFQPCVVCLPLSWAFLSEIDLPDLSEQDIEDFVRLEAEKRFPLAPDDLRLVLSRRYAATEGRRALLVGVPMDYLSNIEKALRAARLRPILVTFGIAALAGEHAGQPRVLLHLGKGFVDLAVTGENFPPLLRNLVWREDDAEEEVESCVLDTIRQLRITLAQLPAERRDLINAAVLYGSGEWPDDARETLKETLAGMGMTVDSKLRSGPSSSPLPGASQAPGGLAPGRGELLGGQVELENEAVSPGLLASAAEGLRRAAPMIQLRPKKKAQTWSFSARLSARNTRWAIGGVLAAVLLVAAAFGLQARQLARLEQEWSEIAPQASNARALQDHVRKYRAWFDDTIPSLEVPKSLAVAFPDNGSVWLKSLRVKERSQAMCSGNASNRADWMHVMEQLGKNKNLDDLQLVQGRGDAPFSFTLTFRAKGVDSGGN